MLLVNTKPTGADSNFQANFPLDDKGRYVIHNVKQGSYGAYAERPRGPSSNPFQASVDMKLTKKTLTITEGGKYDNEDFKLRDQ